ncbi:MAG: sulfatase-like hydrolase/transferase [Myxococcota bacterium]|jgi:choline-sulfatase|nr:sulfatase-like hydrolase/transferase [Myxococcota bacterium]
MIRGFSGALGAALCTLSLFGCKKDPAPAPAPEGSVEPAPAESAAPAQSAAKAPEKPAESPAMNVILLTIDSLRTDVPWLGYSRPNAPNLTKLAERSVVYTHMYSASSYTAKSVATMLTGRYASTLYRDGFFFTKYAGANTFLTEVLSERNIATTGWHAHMYFGRGKGLEQGFATWELVPGISFDAQTDKSITSEKTTKLGIKLLGDPRNTGRQFFAWTHYMDPHDEYHQHPESPVFGKKARDRYDSEIWYADHWIGKLLEFAEQQPWWKNTVVIVTADHGEAFGEHQMYKHAFELWENLVRVPLLVFGGDIKPTRIDLRRSHIDLAPTILELMKVPAPAGFQGASWVPELRGATPEPREPILVELSEDSHNPPRRALILGKYKIIAFGKTRFELYDIEADPSESKNLAKEQPAELERMKKALEERYAALPVVEPYGGAKLKEGGTARGPVGPAKK